MVGHLAVSQDAHGHEIESLLHDTEKIFIMRLAPKSRERKFARFRAWYTIPPTSTRRTLPIPEYYRFSPRMKRVPDPFPYQDARGTPLRQCAMAILAMPRRGQDARGTPLFS